MSELFGNGVQSYSEAYKIDIKVKENYNTCGVNAHKLLNNPKIKIRIDELLKLNFNNEVVDNELSKLMIQNIDLNVKVSAIKEFNKLKQRITEHTEVKIELPQPIYSIKELEAKQEALPEGTTVPLNN